MAEDCPCEGSEILLVVAIWIIRFVYVINFTGLSLLDVHVNDAMQ